MFIAASDTPAAKLATTAERLSGKMLSNSGSRQRPLAFWLVVCGGFTDGGNRDSLVGPLKEEG